MDEVSVDRFVDSKNLISYGDSTMPMSFPDLKTLRVRYDRENSVPYKDGETEADYREQCAVYMETVWKDHVEAHEVRTGKGWDQWNQVQQTDLLKRKIGPDELLRFMINP